MEEAIRWEPATEALPRFATDDIEIGGHLVPGGTVVVLMSMSANHDSAVLPDAGRFDIAREVPDGWHLLTFGGGIHYCLGASLAKLEAVALRDPGVGRRIGTAPAGLGDRRLLVVAHQLAVVAGGRACPWRSTISKQSAVASSCGKWPLPTMRSSVLPGS